MRLAELVAKLKELNPAAQGFWAGHEGVGRGRGPRLASVPAAEPAPRDTERAVEGGDMVEVSGR